MSDELRDILDDYDDSDAPEGLDIAAERGALDTERAGEWERFTLTAPEHFDWAARKRARAKANTAHLEEWKSMEMHKMAHAFDKRITASQGEEQFFNDMIRFGVLSLDPDAKGKRSVKTPHMTAFTITRTEFDWPTDDALVSWAATVDGGDGGELVRVKYAPDKTAIKAYVKETGDIPPGLEVREVESVTIREA